MAVKISVLFFVIIKIFNRIIPRKIRNKLNLGKNSHIYKSIEKKLPEYVYGYLKPNHVKMKLNLKDYIQFRIYLTGYFEKRECSALLNLFPKGGVFLDIGANVGAYSFTFYKKASHVYAFEATEKTFERLRETIETNNIKNITPVFAAVHCKDGEEITLYANSPDDCGGNSMYLGQNIANTVKSLAIDTWVLDNKITDIAMVKIDIEGNELNAFKGMQKSLLKFRPVIFCEFSLGASIAAGTNAVELFNYITNNCNYTAKVLIKNKYKEVDENYIKGLTHNVNCYFSPR